MEEILYWRNNYRKLTQPLRCLEESTEKKVVLVGCQVREGNGLFGGMNFKQQTQKSTKMVLLVFSGKQPCNFETVHCLFTCCKGVKHRSHLSKEGFPQNSQQERSCQNLSPIFIWPGYENACDCTALYWDSIQMAS